VKEFVAVAPLVPVAVGDRFPAGRLPLHMTVLPKVRVPPDAARELIEGLRSAVSTISGPVTALLGERASFGHVREVPVTTVQLSDGLVALHSQLLAVAVEVGGEPIQPSYCGTGYRPHISDVGDEAVTEGRLALATVAVIQCTGSVRTVVAVEHLEAGAVHLDSHWPPSPIRTDRLALREPEPRDRTTMIELLASPEVGTYIGGAQPLLELERVIPDTPRRRPGLFVVEAGGSMIGTVTLDPTDPTHANAHGHRPVAGVELGYLFLPTAWGRGYAAEACTAALDWLAGVLPDVAVMLCTQTANLPSMRLAARLGFREVARYNAYETEQWLGIAAPGVG